MGIFVYNTFYLQNTPESLLKEYYSYISKKDYERMYDLLCRQSREDNPREDFIQRNAAIYEGIEIKKIRIRFDDKKKLKKDSVNYHLTFDTVAGKVSAAYSARIVREKRTYRLIWDDSLIFPELSKTDKVRVLTKEAKRGTIYDRRGKTLAGEGTAVSVNIVPGKCSEDSTERLAELTGLTTDPAVDHPILVISMVENVKNHGGSGYVVEKTRHVLEQYIKMDQND